MGKRRQIKTFFICPKFRCILLRIMSNREFKWENKLKFQVYKAIAGWLLIIASVKNVCSSQKYIFYVAKKKCSDIGNIGNKSTDTDIVSLGPIYRYPICRLRYRCISIHGVHAAQTLFSPVVNLQQRSLISQLRVIYFANLACWRDKLSSSMTTYMARHWSCWYTRSQNNIARHKIYSNHAWTISFLYRKHKHSS